MSSFDSDRLAHAQLAHAANCFMNRCMNRCDCFNTLRYHIRASFFFTVVFIRVAFSSPARLLCWCGEDLLLPCAFAPGRTCRCFFFVSTLINCCPYRDIVIIRTHPPPFLTFNISLAFLTRAVPCRASRGSALLMLVIARVMALMVVLTVTATSYQAQPTG